jgi:hypothetical protein
MTNAFGSHGTSAGFDADLGRGPFAGRQPESTNREAPLSMVSGASVLFPRFV